MIDSRLYDKYKNKIKYEIAEEMKIPEMQVAKITKIVINMGLGEATNDKSVIEDAVRELAQISGQKPIITYAKKSNASFKIREGMPIGVKVTLRQQRMYDFLDKLISISLPRIRDFRGIKTKSFDQQGNFSLGIREYIVFPEIDLDRVRHMKGCDISIVFSRNDREQSFQILSKMGMPFIKGELGENNG